MLLHTCPDTPGKAAVLARSAQLTDTCWTPLRPVPTHSKALGKKIFLPAGQPVVGLPYSSTEPTDKFICENISISGFLSAAACPESALYTRDLGGHRNSWAFFGIVCNGLARYALNIPRRFSTKRWLDIPGMTLVAPPGGYRPEELQLCDILYAYGNGRNHVALITDLIRSEDGALELIQVSEAIFPSCRRACFTPEEYAEKYRLFGICRYAYVDEVPPPQPITWPEPEPILTLDQGDGANYFSAEPVTLCLRAPGPQTVTLFREDGPSDTLTVDGSLTFSPEPGWYTAVHDASGSRVRFCVCRPEIQYTVRDGMLTVRASSTDPKSRVAYLDLREVSRSRLAAEQLPAHERSILQSPFAAPLAQVVELTDEEKDTGVFTRPIHPDAKNFKVVFRNPNGYWTHTILPLT